MYASVHDQPPSALLPHSITSKLVVAPVSGPESKHPLSTALFISSPPHYSTPTLVSSLPATHSLSVPHPSQKLTSASSLSGRCPRRAALNVPMQRTPYSRDTTDISDHELRQILDSENISGLPAPYCLVPHYDAQLPASQSSAWPPPAPHQPSTAPAMSTGQQLSEHRLPAGQQGTQQQILHSYQHQQPEIMGGGGSSQSSSGGHDIGNSQSAPAATTTSAASVAAAAAAATAAPLSSAGDMSRRRTRTTLTPYQLRVLFRVWERTQYPSSDLRARLAASLLMTPRNVQIWFQNQRQKTKERAEMRRRTHSPNLHAAALANAGMLPPPPPSQHHHNLQRPQHVLVPLPAYFPESVMRDGHMSAISMPGRSPPESPFRYTHGPPPAPPAVQPPSHTREHPLSAGNAVSAHNAHAVAGAYTMLTPPALYPHVFSQHQQHTPSALPGSPSLHSSGYSHPQYHHNPPPPPSSSLSAKPTHPPATPRHPHYHLQHQRHYSQPHAIEHPHSRPVSSALAVPYNSSSSSLHDSPRQHPLHPSSQKHIDPRASEMGSERSQAPRLPLAQMQHQSQQHMQMQSMQAHSLNDHHNIPSPATPTFPAAHNRARQTPSPLASRQQNNSPPLLSSMSTLTMIPSAAAAHAAVATPQTMRAPPAARRPQLTNILNPIGSLSGSMLETKSTTETDGETGNGIRSQLDISGKSGNAGSSQVGPLPSLGSVLANVQSDARSDSSAMPAVSAANETTSAAASSEKWRPW